MSGLADPAITAFSKALIVGSDRTSKRVSAVPVRVLTSFTSFHRLSESRPSSKRLSTPTADGPGLDHRAVLTAEPLQGIDVRLAVGRQRD